jgi:hypothetical protein
VSAYGSPSTHHHHQRNRARHPRHSHPTPPAAIMLDTELIQTWEQCNTPNWDGYGAFPVQAETLTHARAFAQALPPEALPDSVGAEPDGHLTLEWFHHPLWTLSVSISPEGTLYYAALLGEFDPRGAEPFLGAVPQKINNLIAMVNSAPKHD